MLRLPEDDQACLSLATNPGLTLITNPILYHTTLPRPEGPTARSYFSDYSQAVVRAYFDPSTEQAVGVVLFSPDAVWERQGNGAVANAFDNLLGVFVIQWSGQVCFSRSLRVRQVTPCPLGKVLEWHCRVERVAGTRVTVSGELLDGGVTVARSSGLFVLQDQVFPKRFERERVLAALKSPPVESPWYPSKEWPSTAEQMVAWVVGNECTEMAFPEWPPTVPCKIRYRLFLQGSKRVYAVVHFTELCGGPPGRVNGGALIAAFETVLGALLSRTCGVDRGEIVVHFNRGVPLGSCCMVKCEWMPEAQIVAGKLILPDKGGGWCADGSVAVTGIMKCATASKEFDCTFSEKPNVTSKL